MSLAAAGSVAAGRAAPRGSRAPAAGRGAARAPARPARTGRVRRGAAGRPPRPAAGRGRSPGRRPAAAGAGARRSHRPGGGARRAGPAARADAWPTRCRQYLARRGPSSASSQRGAASRDRRVADAGGAASGSWPTRRTSGRRRGSGCSYVLPGETGCRGRPPTGGDRRRRAPDAGACRPADAGTALVRGGCWSRCAAADGATAPWTGSETVGGRRARRIDRARQLGRPPRGARRRSRTAARAASPTSSRPRRGCRTAPRSRRCTT